MKLELKRVDPLRAANIVALVYGAMMTVMAVLIAPVFMLALLAGRSGGGPGPLPFLLLIVLYPIIGLIGGWIMGLVGSAAYNFIVRWTGGMLIEFEPVGVPPGSGVV